jgi:hypothetical protein
MKRIILVIKCSLIGWTFSILLSFTAGLIGYWQSGVTPVLKHALFCAVSGGFTGPPLEGIWRIVVGIPCIAYAITGWVLLLSLIVFVVVRVVQMFLALFGKRVSIEPMQNT